MSDKFFQDNFDIEAMSVDDARQVAQIESESALNSWGEQELKNKIADQDFILLVARNKKSQKLTGFIFASLITPVVEILNIAVTEKNQRNGVGSALLTQALQTSALKSCEKCWLEVRESNLAALKFYEKYGFQIVGKRKNYYSHPLEDAVLLEFDFKK